MSLAVEERTAFLELLMSLKDDEWEAPTLCYGWRVRDVVAHVLSYDGLTRAETARLLVRNRFQLDRCVAAALQPYRSWTADALRDRMRRHLKPTGLSTAFNGGIALTDAMIHHQDIRRPLSRARTIPTTRLRAALNTSLIAPGLPSRRHVRRLKLVATDLDWSTGRGPEVTGPGEALLLLIAGRAAAVADCSGPGLNLLTG